MVTTEAPILAPTSPTPPDAEALFKEAQRHRRNKRLKGSAIVVLAVLVASLIGLTVVGVGSRSAPVIPLTQPAFTSTVLKAIKAAGGAAFTLVARSPGPSCSSSSNDQTSVTHGSIDFVNQIMKYSRSSPGCPTFANPLTIQSLTATYKDVGSNVAPFVPTTASRPWLQTPSTVQAGLFSVGDTMLSPDLTPLLSAATGPLVIGRSVTIDGVRATEYRGTTTLAILQRDDPVFVESQSLVPTAPSIKVPVQFWIDDKGRLLRASATEPSYTQAYPLGSEGGQVLAEGAQVSTISDAIPPVAATTPPRLEGIAHMTLTFADFGTRVIALPSPSRTAISGS
jgi:hypothetical protein